MIVMKFGGSSVGTHEAIRQVTRITSKYIEQSPVLVVSALYGVTDMLIEAAGYAKSGKMAALDVVIGKLEERHHTILKDLGVRTDVQTLLNECKHLLKGVAYLCELSPKTSDLLLSFGERLSAKIVSAALRGVGVDSVAVDARELIETDDVFGMAHVNFEETESKTRQCIGSLLDIGRVSVVTGFISATQDGQTTTLGRGGSDYTASIIGAALHAEEIWIWKEVDGILTADPRIVPESRLLPKINYEEAAEMSHFGAKVLHPKTMIPAVNSGIPIRMRNTFYPEARGTVIGSDTVRTDGGVKVVSAIKRLSMVTIEGKGMAGIAGFAGHIFSAAGRLNINIIMFTQSSSEQVICLVISSEDGNRLKEELEAELSEAVSRRFLDAIHVEDDISAVAVVGDGMKGTRGIAGKVFTSIADAGVNVLAIAQGSSERNISFIVREADADTAVRSLHRTFRLHELEHAHLCAQSH